MAPPIERRKIAVKPRSAAILALALVTAACAARVPWKNPSLPQERWSRDWSACKRQSGGGTAAFYDDSNTPSQFRDYDRAQDKKRIDAAVAACMIELGYSPAPRKED